VKALEKVEARVNQAADIAENITDAQVALAGVL
jgi:hypothetical protein